MNRSSAPTVHTTSGTVRGSWRSTGAAFLGIPYAQAPVGPLRFAAPEPVVPWEGVRAATDIGPTPQRRPFTAVAMIPERSVPGDETLSVNVFTPAPGDPAARLPVLVWIHGGGFIAGVSASPWYDGSAFNRDGVVVVSLSYRLGFDGYGWIEDAPQNRGLRDQIAALEWVQREIAAFGGDPDAVTIAGQSAGGTSVMALLATPGAQHLFRSVISHSAAGRTQDSVVSERIGRQIAEAAGVPPTRAGWSRLSEDEVLDVQAPFGFRPLTGPVDAVAVTRKSLFPVDDGLAFGPVVDGELMPHPVDVALARGTGAGKPLLAGTTAHEFTMSLMRVRESLAGLDAREVLVQAGLPPEAAAEFLGDHPELTEPAQQLAQLRTEATFRLPLLRWAEARAARGSAADRTWLYDFRFRGTTAGLAVHCAELPFAWDLLDAPGVPAALGATPPQSLADAMHAAWVRFIRDGDPGWPRWADRQGGMAFDQHSRPAPLYEVERRLQRALDSVRPEHGATGPAPG
ncbi:carboxylesterase/lipase family protein [Modestobacter sp. SYSU DS0290]